METVEAEDVEMDAEPEDIEKHTQGILHTQPRKNLVLTYRSMHAVAMFMILPQAFPGCQNISIVTQANNVNS